MPKKNVKGVSKMNLKELYGKPRIIMGEIVTFKVKQWGIELPFFGSITYSKTIKRQEEFEND